MPILFGSRMRGSARPLILLAIGLFAVAPPAANAFSGLSGALNLLESTRRSSVIPCDMVTVGARRAPSRPKAAKSADAQHTVTELKRMLRSRGLPTSGRKAQLVRRLEPPVTVQGASVAPAPRGFKAPMPPVKVAAHSIEEARKQLEVAGRSTHKASSWTHATPTAFLAPTEASKKDEEKKKEKERREAAAQAEAARRAEEEKVKKESAARLTAPAAPEATEMDEERRMELKARIAEVRPPAPPPPGPPTTHT